MKMKDSETDKIIEMIMQIINRGNTAEVKKNKNGILILEVKKQIRSGK